MALINNIDAVNMVECRDIRVSDEVDGSANNKCAAFRRPQRGPKAGAKSHTARFPPPLTQQSPLVPLASRRYLGTPRRNDDQGKRQAARGVLALRLVY